MSRGTTALTGDTVQTLPAAACDRHALEPVQLEQAMIERARLGDTVAIDWLLERYRSRAVRLAAHVLRRPAEAEDAAQEAFIRAFRSLDSFRGQGRFYTWLYQIVVRICLDRRRLARWEAEAPIEAAAALADPKPEPGERILVEELLDRLDPQMRAILALREIEGLEYSEIAEVLSIPIGRVRWRLHAARAQFQKLWLEAAQETEDV